MHFTLKFLKELSLYDEVQPYKLHGFPELSEEQQTNCVYENIDGVDAQDVRDSKKTPHLGQEGFEIMKAPTSCALSADVFENDSVGMNNILADYIRETMNLVKSKLSADSIMTID